MTLRNRVRDLLIDIHKISAEVADYHVRRMTPAEVKEQFLIHARNRMPGAELSAAGPKQRAGNVSSTRFSRPATMTAGSRHSTLFPDSGTSLPDSEVENRGKLAPSIHLGQAERVDQTKSLGAGFDFASRV
jgi:hypothetical protein